MNSLIAKVAKVGSPTSVVVNKGARDGVALGDRFLLYQPGEEVFDPDTGASLGSLEIVKGRAEVEHVQERMSILRLLLPSQGRTKTPSEIMATVSGIDESERVQAIEVGDWARLEKNT